MASLALGLVGAGIGSLAPAGFTFLGMSGAGLGWAVGSALGNILFAPDGPNTQGPRLSDLSVQTSTRGAPIPKIYGTYRIAGNVIWTAGIQETATTQDVGGKGGGGATHTSYTYSCSFAVGLCEGEIIGVRRVWADSVLIYDASAASTTDELAVSKQAGITIYTGSETQLPDPTIEAAEGTGNVPAHRGLAYVVFDTFQLERYGNRIPNLTFEVVASGSEYYARNVILATGDLRNDSGTDANYVGLSGISSNGSATFIECEGWYSIEPYPDVRVFNVDQEGSISEVLTIDGTIADDAPGTAADFNREVMSFVYTDENITALCNNSGDSIRFVDLDAGSSLGDVTKSGNIYKFYNKYTRIARSGGNTFYFATNTSKQLFVAKASGGYSPTSEIYSNTFSSNGFNYTFGSDGYIYIVDYGTVSATTTADLYKYDTAGSLISSRSITFDESVSNDVVPGGNYCYPAISDSGDIFFVSSYSTKIFFLNGLTAEALGTISTPYTIDACRHADGYIYISSYDTGGEAYLQIIDVTQIVNVTADDLSDVISDLCLTAGVSAIDVSGVTETVYGYARTGQMTARSAIETLLACYQCGCVESDYTLKFSDMSGSAVDTISYSDMVSELSLSRDIETGLPKRVTVSYLDKDSDHLPAVQSAQRIFSSGRVVNEVSTQMSVSEGSANIARLTEKILYRAWTEREKFDFPLTQKFAYLDAGDVVTINSDTSSHVVRITNGQMGLPGLIECSGVATRSSLYSSSVSGIASSYASQSLVLVGDTLFEIMDLPALRDADATSAGFYVAVYGERSNWSSGIVYRSTDGGSSWSGLVTTSTEATMGVTTDALGDGDHKTWDETNTVNISMYNGTLSSDTTANVLNGANAALVGNELIHFRTATLEGDGTYTLSGLLRGMKGTEHETGTHAIGDRFVMLNTTSIYRVSADYSKLNVTDKFKAVTNGQFLDSVTDTTDVTFTNLNAKPLSPCQIYGSRDGSNNLTINWQRRSRLTETSLDDPGLGEATELYEVHIMSGGVAVRVIQSTSNSASYTASQQTADGLTPGDPVTVNIYQVSDTVGRGYVRSETV